MADPLQSIKDARGQFLANLEIAMGAALTQAAHLLMAEMQALTAHTDHSLKDLRDLDHPYAWRHPAGNLHPDWETHIQRAGESVLNESFFVVPTAKVRKKLQAAVGNDSPHLWYLLLGTQHMRPRDFGTAAITFLKDDIGVLLREAHASVHDSHRGYQGLDLTIKPLKHKLPAQLPND